MKNIITLILCFLFSTLVFANDPNVNLNTLGQKYFNAWASTQKPNASESDISNYLELLTNDVGHQHLPYDPDDTRDSDGKNQMRKGMMYYLGVHTEYFATLKSIATGYNVIIIKYDTKSTGIHPQSKQKMILSYETTEVLEIEKGKVSVIRKYSE